MGDNQASLMVWIVVGLIVGGLAGFLINRLNTFAFLHTFVPDRTSAVIGLLLGAGAAGLVGMVLVAVGSVPVGCEAVTAARTSTPPAPSANVAGSPAASAPAPGASQTQTAPQPPDPTLVAELESDATAYLSRASCLVAFNNTVDVWIKIGAIAVAFITTVASQQKWTLVGVASGALVTALTGAQAAFPLGDRANFYRAIEARTDRVLSDVRLGQLDVTGFEAARIRLEDIKADGAKGPGGSVASTPTPTPTPTPSPAPAP